MTIYNLPAFTQKDFYGKAQVITQDGKTYLKSYDTIVACVDENKKLHIRGDYSHTTFIHINDFCMHILGIDGMGRQKNRKPYYDYDFDYRV